MSRSAVLLRRSAALACCLVLAVVAWGCDKPSSTRVPTVVPTVAPPPTAVPQAITSVKVPILMYHHLKALPEDADADYQSLAVSPKIFLEQVAYLQRAGYHTITFADLVGAFGGRVSLPEKPVIITFDDGWEDIYTVAYPILREHGLTATFFIPANWIENVEGTLSWAQIEELSAAGMEFGSHSMTHPYLTQSEPDMLKWELEASKTLLEKHTNQKIVALAYPFGLYDDTVMSAVWEAGYRAAATIDHGALAKRDEVLLLPRLWVYDWMDEAEFARLLETS